MPALVRAPEEYQAAQRIRLLRHLNGDLVAARQACLEAATAFPKNSFFAILAVDLHVALREPAAAAEWLIEALRRWEPGNNHFAKFATNFHRVERLLSGSEAERLRTALRSITEAREPQDPIRQQSEQLLGLKVSAGEETWTDSARELGRSLDRREPLAKVTVLTKRVLQEGGSVALEAVLDAHLLGRERRAADLPVELHMVSQYEEMGRLNKALSVAESLAQLAPEPVYAAPVFRLCRKLEDYAPAQRLLDTHPHLLGLVEFNLMYELVFFYESRNDLEKAKQVLDRVEKGHLSSKPIQTTVRNFYLRLGLLDEAQRIDARLASGGPRPPGYTRSNLQEEERRQALSQKAKEVGAEVHDYLLHQQQLAAISELTRGISHELGQPITNVRFTVQFYLREFEREFSREKVLEVFQVILRQTERMGDLVKRLSPLTSSRRVFAHFDAVARVRANLEAVSTRLSSDGITANVVAKGPVMIDGDIGHFDQITSNLIVNAIDALATHSAPGSRALRIEIREFGQSVQLTVEDNGPGFPLDGSHRIFNPFYTTKPPGKGEGLGLFIVWNLLKMQGGTISLDSNYTDGARFKVTIRKSVSPSERTDL